jgi:hypothetical protein
MIVEVINRPYRKYKVGERFSLKEKQAKVLILVKRVKEISEREEKKEAAKENIPANIEQPVKARRGRKPGSKNKPKGE